MVGERRSRNVLTIKASTSIMHCWSKRSKIHNPKFIIPNPKSKTTYRKPKIQHSKSKNVNHVPLRKDCKIESKKKRENGRMNGSFHKSSLGSQHRKKTRARSTSAFRLAPSPSVWKLNTKKGPCIQTDVAQACHCPICLQSSFRSFLATNQRTALKTGTRLQKNSQHHEKKSLRTYRSKARSDFFFDNIARTFSSRTQCLRPLVTKRPTTSPTPTLLRPRLESTRTRRQLIAATPNFWN